MFFGLPLVINNGYFNISAAKSLYFLCVSIGFCLLSIMAHLFFSIKKIKLPIKFALTDIMLIAFAVANIVSAYFSKYGKGVWLGTESRIQGAIIILLYVLTYLLISNRAKNIVKNSNLIQLHAVAFLVVIILAVLHSLDISITGVFTHLIETQRNTFISTIGNINFFSSYICLCLPVFVVFFVNSENRNYCVIWGIVLAFCGIAAVLSCSDGFILGFLGFLAVAPFFFTNNKKIFIRFWTAIGLIFLSAAIFYYIYKLFPKQIYMPSQLLGSILSPVILTLIIALLTTLCVLAHFFPKFLKNFRYIYFAGLFLAFVAVIAMFIYSNREYDPNAKSIWVFNDNWGTSRGRCYRFCFEVLREFNFKEWLIGIGPETLQFRFFEHGITHYDQAHSEYLQILITTGVCGLITYIGTIAATFFLVVRKLKNNSIALAFFFGLIAYWTQATISIAQSFTTPFVYLYLAIIVCEYKQSLISFKEEIK